MKKGIKSLGAYLPYHYLTRAALGAAWGGKGGKGEKSVADVDLSLIKIYEPTRPITKSRMTSSA